VPADKRQRGRDRPRLHVERWKQSREDKRRRHQCNNQPANERQSRQRRWQQEMPDNDGNSATDNNINDDNGNRMMDDGINDDDNGAADNDIDNNCNGATDDKVDDDGDKATHSCHRLNA
jgi:hypothetical protein